MTLDDLITNYLKLRDRRDHMKKVHAAVIKQYDDAMELIGAQLKAHLQTQGLQRTATTGGTAFLKTTTSATVGDKSAFRDFVIANGNYDLIDFRANKTGVEAYLEANKALPPGVNYSSFEDVGVQRS